MIIYDLTICPMLEGVLALEELAGGVVSLTDPAGIQGGLGAQNLVAAYSLNTHTQTQKHMQSMCKTPSCILGAIR